MKVFLVRNSCLLAEAVVIGYGNAEAAIDVVERQMRMEGQSSICARSNFSAHEVLEHSIIWRELEEE